MNPGDKIRVLNGSYAGWEGHVRYCYESTLVGAEVRYRNLSATITISPHCLQVIEAAPAQPAPSIEPVPGWEYYTPDDEDEDNG